MRVLKKHLLSKQNDLEANTDSGVLAAEKRHRHRVLALIVSAIVIAVDQAAKHWALTALDEGHVINLVGPLRFRLVFNTGAAFGKFDSLGPVLGVLAFAVSIWLFSSRVMVGGRPSAIAVGSVVGGAIGNSLDRLFRAEDGVLNGAVVDFIDIRWWPVWNVADMGIVLGAVALVWCIQSRNTADTETTGQA